MGSVTDLPWWGGGGGGGTKQVATRAALEFELRMGKSTPDQVG